MELDCSLPPLMALPGLVMLAVMSELAHVTPGAVLYL